MRYLILITFSLMACGEVTMPDQPDGMLDAVAEIDAPVPDAAPPDPPDPNCRVELVYLSRYETNLSSSRRMVMSHIAVIVNHGATAISLSDFTLREAISTPPSAYFQFVVQAEAEGIAVPGKTAYGWVGIPDYADLLGPYVTQPWTNDGTELLLLDTGNVSEATMIYAMATYLDKSAPVAVEIAHNPDLTNTTPTGVARACLLTL